MGRMERKGICKLNGKTLYLHTITPLHSGTGQTVAVIDLPVAREKATGYPVIPASSLKGVLRDAAGGKSDAANRLFGSLEKAGAISIGDQRLLCLPVRSYFGTFAYISCPLALGRFVRDLEALGLNAPFKKADVPVVDDTTTGLAVVLPNAPISSLKHGAQVFLEDLDLAIQEAAGAAAIAEGLAEILFNGEETMFTTRFGLVSDNVFSYLCETALEVSARVALHDETKTVRTGGLWYEEAVPAEAIFAGPVLIESRFEGTAEEAFAAVNRKLIQVGGKSSVGRGLCRMIVGE